MGTKDYDDIISLLNESISLGYVDKNRVAIGGWSQGGCKFDSHIVFFSLFLSRIE